MNVTYITDKKEVIKDMSVNYEDNVFSLRITISNPNIENISNYIFSEFDYFMMISINKDDEYISIYYNNETDEFEFENNNVKCILCNLYDVEDFLLMNEDHISEIKISCFNELHFSF